MEERESELGRQAGETGSFGWQGWAKVLAFGILCATLGAVWARYAMLIHRTSHVAESVPPLSAVAALILLLALRPLLGRFGWFAIGQREILCAYAFVCMAVTIGFIGLYRQVLGLLTTFIYGDEMDTTISAVRPYLPEWLVPTDREVIRMMWEGLKGESLPWKAWAIPLLSLGGIFVAFYLTCTCLIGLFHRRWSRDERLRYPVSELALEIVGEGSEIGLAKFVRDHWFWIGGLLALGFNLVYIIPALADRPIPPVQFDLNDLGMSPPWDAGKPGPYFRLNPIVFGLGFLVPLDVLFTIWAWVFFIKLEAVLIAYFGVPSGWGGPLFLMARQEGQGAYLALFLVILWTGRRYLGGALKDCVGAGQLAPGAPGRWSLAGLVAGAGIMLFVLHKAGMVLWFAALFLAMLLIRVLAMARVRAQAGVPNIYLHVFEIRSMMWLLGGATLAAAGVKTVAALVFMSFLFDCTLITPYLADGFRICEHTGFGYRRWIWLSTLAVITGFVLATLAQFTAIYDYGFGPLEQRLATWPGNEVLAVAKSAKHAEPMRMAIAGLGFVTTMGLAVLQRAFYWFPFNSLGFVVACAIGDYVCGPVFFAWLLKKLTLKYGGGPAYRAARGFCIGLVFAHLSIAAVWGVLGAFDFPPTRRYAIGFW
jgi:hypothetical protein